MSRKKSSGNSKRNFYSDDMTKAVIGNLFAEYAAEDGKNYFASADRDVEDVPEPEPEEPVFEEPEEEEPVEELDIPKPSFKRRNVRRDFEEEEEDEDRPKKQSRLPKRSSRSMTEDDDESVRDTRNKPRIPKFMQEYSGDDIIYDEDDEEDDVREIELPVGRVAIVVIIVVIVALLLWLAVSRSTFKSQLVQANAQIEELTKQNTSSTYEKEINELKAQVDELTAENDRLKSSAATVNGGTGTSTDNNNNNNGNNNTNSDENNTENNNSNNDNSDEDDINQNSSDETSYTVYTVKAGDYPYSISEEVYGDGSRYDEILEFNNITGDDLVQGMELKIPN